MNHKIKLISTLFLLPFLMAGCAFASAPLTDEESIVTDNPTSLKFDKENLSLYVGDKVKINPIFAPANCNKKLVWSSDSPSIVGVDDSGNIVAKKQGKTTISAKTVNDLVATCEVTVLNFEVSSITLEMNEIEMAVGTTYSISNYRIEPSNATANIKFEVESSSSTILSVDSSGLLSALSMGEGLVYIYDDANENNAFNQNSEVYASLRVTVVERLDFVITSTVNAPFYPSATIDVNSDNATNITICTFNMTQTIPYISGSQVSTMFKKYSSTSNIYKKYSNYYAFEFAGGAIRLYPDNNLMVLHDWHKFISPYFSTNNGYPLDVCSPSNNTILRTSNKTKEIVSHTSDINILLTNYLLKLVEFNGEIYLPFDMASSFVFHDIANFVYDGTRIYDTSVCSDDSNASRIPYIYSSENAFSFYDDNFEHITFYKQSNVGTNQKYVYRATHGDDYSLYINAQMVFNNDGTGTYVCGVNNDGSYTNFRNDPDIYNAFSFTYEEDTEKKLIKVKKSGSSNYNYYIATRASRFGKNEFTSGYKDYWYNSLCLKLDFFYGLKWKLTSGSFVDYFKSAELSLYKNSFSSTAPDLERKDTIYNLYRSAQTVDQASRIVANIFSYYFGDGHSGYTSPSPLGSYSTFAANRTSSFNRSQRRITLSNTINNLQNRKTAAQGSTADGVYFDSDKRLAVLQFSSFSTSIIRSGTNYTSFENDDSLVYSGDNNINHYSVNEEGFKNIAKQLTIINRTASVKNIIFDTTTNGGGQARLIPLLLAFMTKDPVMVVRSTVTGGITEYHYTVDLNGNGTYGEDSDTLATRFKFFILQSSYSFSSGTAFSAAAKNTGAATILGDQRSGGGSCVVAYGNDALGNLFRISGTLEIMMPDGNGGFASDDDGVLADQVIDRDYFYNPNALANTITNLNRD